MKKKIVRVQKGPDQADETFALYSSLPRNKVLHWFLVYTIITGAVGGISNFILYFIENVLQTASLYAIVTPVQALNGTGMFIIMRCCISECIWILMTYKRFSYSKGWRTFALITLGLNPLIVYNELSSNYMQIIQTASMTAVSVSRELMAASVLITLIPFVLLLWTVKKAKGLSQNRRFAPLDKVKGKLWKRLHWAIAFAIVIVVWIILEIKTNALPFLQGSMNAKLLAAKYYCEILTIILSTFLWVFITRKRYAESVSWQAGTLLIVSAVVTIAYRAKYYTFIRLSGSVGKSVANAATGLFSPLHFVIGLLLAALPLLYLWRIAKKANRAA